MRNEIIIYCKDEEDIKQTCEYIKELNIFNEGCIYKDQATFFNYTEDGDIKERIRCITFRENVRGIRGNIGLLTSSFQEYLKNSEDIMNNIIYCSIGDYFRYIENRQISRSLIAPLSMLEKIMRNDITYVLVRDYSDLEYKTNDVVSALGYLESNPKYLLCIGKQSDSKCEVIANLDINKERSYEEIVKIISELKI